MGAAEVEADGVVILLEVVMATGGGISSSLTGLPVLAFCDSSASVCKKKNSSDNLFVSIRPNNTVC